MGDGAHFWQLQDHKDHRGRLSIACGTSRLEEFRLFKESAVQLSRCWACVIACQFFYKVAGLPAVWYKSCCIRSLCLLRYRVTARVRDAHGNAFQKRVSCNTKEATPDYFWTCATKIVCEIMKKDPRTPGRRGTPAAGHQNML